MARPLPLLLFLYIAATVRAGEWPKDRQIINVRDHGAVGDGKTDDTAAINKAIAGAQERRHRIVYFPDGTYLLSDTLRFKDHLTFEGQSRGKTVVRLKDATPGFHDAGKPRAVIHAFNGSESVGNNIRSLTIDTGKNNPAAIALRFTTQKHGMIEDVTIVAADGRGKVGVDLSEAEFGPAIVRNISVDGFDVGIKTAGLPSIASLEHITLKNQRICGIENRSPLFIRDLNSTNTVPAIMNRPGAVTQLVMIDSNLAGGSENNAAIDNTADIVLRNVKTAGYKSALNDWGKILDKKEIDLWTSGKKFNGFDLNYKPLALAVEDPPVAPVEPLDNWKSVDGTERDDTAAIQAAMDSGAATIFFGSDTQYFISGTVRVPASVRRIVCAGDQSIKGDKAVFSMDRPFLRLEGQGSEPLVIEGLTLSLWPQKLHGIEIATRRPVYLRNISLISGGIIKNTVEAKGGKLFVDGQTWLLQLDHPMTAWIRGAYLENNAYQPGNTFIPTHVVNGGGTLWMAGAKSEFPAIHVLTNNGGKAELLGGLFRDQQPSQNIPYFKTESGASMTATYAQFSGQPGQSRTLQATESRSREARHFATQPNSEAIGIYRAGE